MKLAEQIKAHLDYEAFFRAELGELKPGTNGNFQAACPFHEDRDPSLSVNFQTGLFNCFGCDAQGDVFGFYQKRYNCDFREALESLARFAGLDPDECRQIGKNPGLTLAQFAAAKKLPTDFLTQHGVREARGKDGRPYLVFEYRGVDGQVIPEATRMRFSMAEKPKAKRGGKPAPYGLWKLQEALAEDGELNIIEGESDALSAWSYGLPALGVPGKTTTRLLDPTALGGFKSVYVWQEPGAEDFPLGVAQALPGFTVRRMIPPEGLKDLSEAHCRGLDVLALVRQMQREAQIVNPGAAEEPGRTISASALLARKFQASDDVISGGILPSGGGLIIAGESGDGKSLLRSEMAVRLALGHSGLGLEIPKPRRVFIIQSENTHKEEAYRLRQILQGLEVDTSTIGNFIRFSNPRQRFNLAKQKDVNLLQEIIKESQTEVIIYDPLTSFHNINENDNVAIRGILDTITNINRTMNVTSIVIHHFGKPAENTPNAYRTRGASSIKDWADTLITLTRKKHEHKTLRLLEFVKVRNGPEPKPILLERDEYFLHHPVEEDVICPPEKVAEIIKNQGGQVEGYEALKQLISQEVNCSPRAAANFIRIALERGAIERIEDPQDKRKRIFEPR